MLQYNWNNLNSFELRIYKQAKFKFQHKKIIYEPRVQQTFQIQNKSKHFLHLKRLDSIRIHQTDLELSSQSAAKVE